MVLKHAKMRKTFKGAVSFITEAEYLKDKKSSKEEVSKEEEKE